MKKLPPFIGGITLALVLGAIALAPQSATAADKAAASQKQAIKPQDLSIALQVKSTKAADSGSLSPAQVASTFAPKNEGAQTALVYLSGLGIPVSLEPVATPASPKIILTVGTASPIDFSNVNRRKIAQTLLPGDRKGQTALSYLMGIGVTIDNKIKSDGNVSSQKVNVTGNEVVIVPARGEPLLTVEGRQITVQYTSKKEINFGKMKPQEAAKLLAPNNASAQAALVTIMQSKIPVNVKTIAPMSDLLPTTAFVASFRSNQEITFSELNPTEIAYFLAPTNEETEAALTELMTSGMPFTLDYLADLNGGRYVHRVTFQGKDVFGYATEYTSKAKVGMLTDIESHLKQLAKKAEADKKAKMEAARKAKAEAEKKAKAEAARIAKEKEDALARAKAAEEKLAKKAAEEKAKADAAAKAAAEKVEAEAKKAEAAVTDKE
ncbi:MAG: hypothetical protein AAFX93_15505 [Verrucomicrobiota bacterium]